MTNNGRAAAIAAQNDAFRRSLGTSSPGRYMMTRGVALLPDGETARILMAVRQFTTFTPGNDPHGEHDFGRLDFGSYQVFWKIDYYADASLTYGAEDPQTSYRVLMVMLADEY